MLVFTKTRRIKTVQLMPLGAKVPILKIRLCSLRFRESELQQWREIPLMVMWLTEWPGRLMCRAIGFGTSLLLFLTSSRCSRKRSPTGYVLILRCKACYKGHSLCSKSRWKEVQSKWSLIWRRPLGPRIEVVLLTKWQVLQRLREHRQVPCWRFEGKDPFSMELRKL